VRIERLELAFIETRPDVIEHGVLYVSLPFRTSVHLCCCGCGNEVWLPIRPDRWKLTYDGETASFTPSIGNWSFPCQSHYWIREGRVVWAPAWSTRRIADGRRHAHEHDRGLDAVRDRPRSWWKRALHVIDPRRFRS
jgi:hypothetical protein